MASKPKLAPASPVNDSIQEALRLLELLDDAVRSIPIVYSLANASPGYRKAIAVDDLIDLRKQLSKMLVQED